MADITQLTNYTGKYSGLLNNFYVTVALVGICVIGHEIEVHVPRRRGKDGTFKRIPVRVFEASKRIWGEWRNGKRRSSGGEERPSQEGLVREKEEGVDKDVKERARLGDRESWEFGYIYQPKAWRLDPAPPVPRWPLAWIWSALSVKERDMPETCGLDLTLHLRFLRGAFFYVLLQACIVLPILMPLHVFYSPKEIPHTSMIKASVSSLVESSGRRWLWIHALLIWWVTITWTSTVLWITWGALAYRRREIKRLAARVAESRERKNQASGNEEGLSPEEIAERWTVGDDCEGIKKFRTVLVTNVPPDMRSEDILGNYFDHYIHRHQVRCGHLPAQRAAPVMHLFKEDTALQRVAFSPHRLLKRPRGSKPPPSTPVRTSKELLDRSTSPDSDCEEDQDGNTWESEVEEVVLVRKLGSIASLRGRRMAVLRQLEVAHVKLAQRVLKAVSQYKTKHPEAGKNRVVVHPAHDIEKGIVGLNSARDELLSDDLTKAERMERLVQALGGFVDDEPEQIGRSTETVWDVLHALPRELLDPYQSLTHLTSLFRDQNAPLIDYLSTKLSYLTLLLDEARGKPLSAYASSSAAFVTFRDARTARLALKILDSHPKRSLACHTAAAPDWTDLLWPRLGKSVYRSEFVRGWVVYLGVWAFTLIWIFPVSLLCALSSLTNISGFITPLKDFFIRHPKTASVITSLAPVILVAGLTIAICPILLVIANKAETIHTRLGIHNSVLERFWKFLMVNGVVFFAIGQSAIEAYLVAFQDSSFNPLPTVAQAFPSAAPYFASYVLLQTAIQPFFELFRLGLPAIVYVFGTRVSVVPRQRNARTEHPTFSHFSQLPMQLLAGAIMHLFMILNPLVIPFCLVYYGSCYLVWKRQLTYVYGRLYENNGRRSSIRILRYSLDALALSQFVLFAFFILNKAKGHAIATGILFFMTVLSKLIITRALKRRFDSYDRQEGDILCPPVPREDLDNIPPSRQSVEEWTPQEQNDRPVSEKTTRYATLRHGISGWADKWGYATSHRTTAAGYRKPIPFDHVIFSTLDSKISFDKDEEQNGRPRSSTVVTAASDAEMRHEPDHAIVHDPAQKLVMPHHALRLWEDIPPYQRARGFNDQPAYTDDYDDFLWLPRDPLSTLDLDDTVEMRLALTTSAGGSGRIGDWPPVIETETDTQVDDVEDEVWQEIYRRASVCSPTRPAPLSPGGNSERMLIDKKIELSPHIGSEVDDGFDSGLVRRSTKKVGEGLTSLFKRPRSGTNRTDKTEGAFSMRTLSITSTPSNVTPMPSDENAPLTASTSADGRPSIQLVTRSQAPSHPLPTPGPQISTSAATSATRRPDSSRKHTGDSVFLSPATASPRIIEPHDSPDPMEELDIASPRPSQLTIQLGRSASGRRPSRMRANSKASDLRSPTRTASILSPHRAKSLKRDLSTSVLSVQQQALMNEVMEEERLASENAHKEFEEEVQRDTEELAKEQEKRRRGSVSVGVGRSTSRASEAIGLGRSMSRIGEVVGRSGSKRFGERRGSGLEMTERPTTSVRTQSGQSAESGSGSGTLRSAVTSPAMLTAETLRPVTSPRMYSDGSTSSGILRNATSPVLPLFDRQTSSPPMLSEDSKPSSGILRHAGPFAEPMVLGRPVAVSTRPLDSSSRAYSGDKAPSADVAPSERAGKEEDPMGTAKTV